MAYKGYGILGGEDFRLPLQGGRTHTFFDPEALNLGKTDFSKTKIKPKVCADGTLPPCDEDSIVTNGGGCLAGQVIYPNIYPNSLRFFLTPSCSGISRQLGEGDPVFGSDPSLDV